MNMNRLTSQLLIAMPSLKDPNFSQSVTLICEHNPQGALGIVISRPMDIALGELLEHIDIPPTDEAARDELVYAGGPVQMDRGFVLHQPRGRWESTLTINENLGLTTSRDILTAVASGKGPEKRIVALGYAGWSPGQLEDELADNAWLTVPSDTEILFATPPQERWQAAARKLGIDLNLIADEAGHA